MGIYEYQKIGSNEKVITWGYTGLMQFGNEYLLSNGGQLIDDQGNLVWNVKWEHYFSDAIYIKDRQMLLTDRTIYLGVGGEFNLGIACIDMETGEYKWRHFYDKYQSRISLRKKEPDINIVRGIDAIDTNENCVYSDGFKINIDDGTYIYTGESRRQRRCNDENIIYSCDVKSHRKMLHLHNEDTSMIKIKINIIVIEGDEFSKEGYFLNKCDFVMSTEGYLYFWGVPAKRNPKSTILFKYSKTLKSIVEEIEMPFRSAPGEVYDFFGKGSLISSGGDMWLFKDFYLD